ncbi:hypothetical protein BZA05DRAFT_413409 [Tricharina praecox]|uniref:uncharacterized protein n=1 Tax=Tricharina praecox TaxID=43433 RepID=UPI0022208E38|nr:uncharacterized protein BZA05DRAFT_413409 [Tricharina praecox]KAI5841236.1 hypothetical protein BZA05DRAFT_413409 [Tricharina praecox]
MSSPLSYVPPDLPPFCEPDTPVLVFLSQTFGTCLPSYLSFFSTAAGVLSINYRRGSVDGLSLGFLAIWLAGDICNLLGAIWTSQMWFQQVVGMYYVLVDVVLVSQYFYFTNINPPELLFGQQLHYDESIDDDDDSDDSYLVDSEPETNSKKKKKEARSNSSGSRGRSRSLASTLIVVVSMMFHLAGASPISPPPRFPCSGWRRKLAGHRQRPELVLDAAIPELSHCRSSSSTSDGARQRASNIALRGRLLRQTSSYSLSLLLNPLGHYDYQPTAVAASRPRRPTTTPSGGAARCHSSSAPLACSDSMPRSGWQWLMWGERAPEDFDELDGDDDDCLALQETTWSRWWPWNGGKPLVANRAPLP